MGRRNAPTGLRQFALRTLLAGSLWTVAPFTLLAGSPVISSIGADTPGVERLFRVASTTVSNKHVSSPVQAGGGDRRAHDVAVKAAFLYNFVKFTEWPALPKGVPILACIVGADEIAAAFVEILRVHTVRDHPLVLAPSQDKATWRTCHVLFVADAEIRRSADGLAGITTLPVLTVGDTRGFAQAGGIIELRAEAGQMRFMINVDAAERSGLRLSSGLLSLATIVRQANLDGNE